MKCEEMQANLEGEEGGNNCAGNGNWKKGERFVLLLVFTFIELKMKINIGAENRNLRR